jgi:hypothetical protein
VDVELGVVNGARENSIGRNCRKETIIKSYFKQKLEKSNCKK